MDPYLLEMGAYLPKMNPYLLKMGPVVIIIARLCESMHMWSCLKPVFVNPCTRCPCLGTTTPDKKMYTLFKKTKQWD